MIRSALLFLVVSYCLINVGCSRVNQSSVQIWVPGAPFSADPLQSNYVVHQIVFRSILATLISKHRIGEYAHLLVDSWRVSPDHREWIFVPRKGLLFDNGDPIDAKAIVSSFKRIAFVSKAGKFRPSLFSKLVGVENLKSPTTEFSGISVSKDENIVFRFTAPVPDLLEIISASAYAVSHPANYDLKTGAWLDRLKVVASGPYRLVEWGNERVTLKRRDNFSIQGGHDRPIDKFEIVWRADQQSTSDLRLGHSSSAPQVGYEFFGGPVSGIAYVRCHSWTNADRICGQKLDRLTLRERFYSSLRRRGLSPSGSFFPDTRSQTDVTSFRNDGVRAKGNVTGYFLPSKSSLNPFFSAYGAALVEAGGAIGISMLPKEITPQQAVRENAPNLKAYLVDFSVRATEVDFGSIQRELYNMFIDPSGLQLPDPDETIRRYLLRGGLSLEYINHKIADQGAIWPLMHFAQGFYARKGLFDFSLLNPMATPIELVWLGFE
ncbi:MAG: hypothetical protein A2X94_02460 [Bdellovibrionales bacterium GWB1_55_8]|nr:MAG: hypothetical protein A2X94_02460 [Bdellovibrionales bacterium GWB1_55_8]